MDVLVVGIAGGTGSGKSTVAQKIGSALPQDKVAVLEYDAYYRDRPDLGSEERAQLNFDHPDALETELLVEHVRTLKSGEPIQVPTYDFTTHSRSTQWRDVAPVPLVIVEGILTFVDPRLRGLLDIKIFVDTDSDIRAFRRVRRDIEKRGRTFNSVREQYYTTVRPMHLEFVEPSKRWADIIVPEGGENNVAIDLLITKMAAVLAES
jgi:uridine kinase